MTQSTLEMFDAHAKDYEFEERRAYKRAPRATRKRKSFGKRKRAASLSMNGRNKARSTLRASYVSKLAMEAQSGNV